MSEYICKKCNYKTSKFFDMYRHLMRTKRCIKCLSGYKYTIEEILKLSLIPYRSNKQNIDITYDKCVLKLHLQTESWLINHPILMNPQKRLFYL